jgi:DNA-repair protein complementing XP-A cells
MHLFLRYQVEEYAFSAARWGSAAALDAEFEEREEKKRKTKEAKFKSKLKELKKNSRTEAFLRNSKNGGKKGQFGDRVGGGKHEHEWGQTVENADGESVKTCLECGMEVEVMEF